MKKYFAPLVLLLMVNLCFAQPYTYSGKILDAKSKKPLAFVAIIISGQNRGVQTDIDGKYKISSVNPNETFKVNYVGYESKTVKLDHAIQNDIYLKEVGYVTAEAQVIAGENPAHRIIRKAIDNRKVNNPEKQTSFKYVSYNKFYVTAKKDTAEKKTGGVVVTVTDGSDSVKNDSVAQARARQERRTDSIFSRMNLFMTESVTERTFVYPDLNNEVIKASKISGLRDPQFVLLASQFQSFTFYKDYITILDKNFLSPLVPGSPNKYFFNIEDTLYNNNDSVFVISFKPRKGKNFDGLKGLVYINNNGYAIQNVIAEPEVPMMFNIKIQQQYERINNQYWFPTQLNTDIDFGGGATINGRSMIVVGRTYLKDIEIGVPVKKRELTNIEVDYDVQSIKNSSDILNKHRIDTLSDKDKETYRVIDSIGKADNFDKYMKLGKVMAEGKVPLGYINADLDKILAFNRYEGVRVGLGASTSDKLSTFFSLNGYGAYGTKDGEFKYGGGINLNLNKRKGMFLYAKYQNDVIESGSVKVRLEKKKWGDIRNFSISNMDKIELKEAGFTFRSLNYLTSTIFVNQQERTVTNSYRFIEGDRSENNFNISEIGISFRYAFREKLMRQADALISTGTRYPVLFLEISNGMNNLSDMEFEYLKYDLKIQKSFLIRNFGKTSLTLNAGYIDGNAAAPFAYYGRANDINISAKESFETMEMNEFLSSQYAAVFFEHNFAKLLFQTKNFQPQLSVVTNVGFGKLDHSESHTGISYKTMEKGYYESGLKIYNLYALKTNLYNMGLGVGGFYEYGPYAAKAVKNNLELKLNALISF